MPILAHISDLHFNRIDPAVADALVADLHEARPDVLVISGDFTQRARRRQYADAAAYIARLPGPQILVPGNHDIPLYDVFRRFLYPLDRYRHYITRDLRPFYHDNHLAILGINTARSWTWRWKGFWKDGRISTEQLLDIRLRFSHLPPSVFKIVVTHHPFIPPPKERLHGIVGGVLPALDTLVECGVDMLLAGHLHMGYSADIRTHFEAVKRSILSIQAGTAISTRRRHEPNAYNLIHIHPNDVAVHVRAWTGSRFDQTDLTRYTRPDHEWRKEDSSQS